MWVDPSKPVVADEQILRPFASQPQQLFVGESEKPKIRSLFEGIARSRNRAGCENGCLPACPCVTFQTPHPEGGITQTLWPQSQLHLGLGASPLGASVSSST